MSIPDIVKQAQAQFEAGDFFPASLIKNEEDKNEYEKLTRRKLVLYDEIIKFAALCKINPSDIYFSNKGLSAYYYYKFPILVDILIVSSDYARQMKVEEHIRQVSEVLQKSLDEGSYENLFIYMDSRIKMMAFNELFERIPNDKIYETFVGIYTHGEYGFHILQPYIDRVISCQSTQYRKQMLDKLEKDAGEGEFLTVYRGQGTESTPTHKAMSWTLKLETALFFAKRYNIDGEVYKAKVRKVDVIDYLTSRGEAEILVKPEKLIEVEDLQYVKTSDEIGYLQEFGALYIFHEYKEKLDDTLFQNPYGIHGIKHTERVMIHLISLSYALSLDDEDVDVLMRAALFHDIGRTHDGVDDYHGTKSWLKVKELNLLDFESNDVDDTWKEDNEEAIEFLIKNHCLDDEICYRNLEKLNSNQNERLSRLLKVFKDADNLDRVRLRDLDPKYLRLEESQKRVLFAEGLYTGHN